VTLPPAGDVEAIRVGEAALVAVRGAVHEDDPAAPSTTSGISDGFARNSARWSGFSASSLNSVPVSPAVLSTPPRNSTIISPRISEAGPVCSSANGTPSTSA
jgi:hypothetical protein